MAKDKPDIWFNFRMKLLKIDKNKQRYTDGPEVFYYQGNKSRFLTHALASAIKYLIIEKIKYNVDHLSADLIQTNQQDP